MESLNNKKYNSEVIVTFVAVIFAIMFASAILGVIFYVINYYGIKDNIATTFKGALLTWLPVAILICSCLVFLVCLYLYAKSSKLAKKWDGEDEITIDKLEHDLFLVNAISNITVVLILLFAGLNSCVGFEAASHVASTVLGIIAIMFTIVWTTALQGRVVSLEYELKQDCYANVLDFGFYKRMFEGKDEGQKMIIYKSAYEVYKSLVWINAAAFLVANFGNRFFETGIMAVILICLSWLAETIIYFRATYKYKNKGRE